MIFLAILLAPFILVGQVSAQTTTVTLPATVAYQGVLTDGDGKVISGVGITLKNATYTSNPAQTQSDGSFIVYVPQGTYTLTLGGFSLISQNETYVIGPISMPGLTVSGPTTTQNLTIPTKTLTISVVDANSQAVSGASIQGTYSQSASFQLYPGGPTATMASGENSNGITTDQTGIAILHMITSTPFTYSVTPPIPPYSTLAILNASTITL
ncbi:MAG: hypothetical protein KGL95_09715, partial [Patescibacteria group bacterium]|nr:hypothetical protein [Patescibacteria group bacterium]